MFDNEDNMKDSPHTSDNGSDSIEEFNTEDLKKEIAEEDKINNWQISVSMNSS